MTLVFATQNLNKLKEVQALLPSNIKLLSLGDVNCFEELEETTGTIEGNAIQKADYIYSTYGYNCFADDTGLEVDALDGRPGVYSARYAGPDCHADDNMKKLLEELKDKINRSAQFRTVIALKLNGELICFEGICEGEILKDKTGEKGFGYDPIFRPAGHSQSFAEMELKLKNSIGHRGKAISKLVDYLSEKAVNF